MRLSTLVEGQANDLSCNIENKTKGQTMFGWMPLAFILPRRRKCFHINALWKQNPILCLGFWLC